MPGKIKVKVLAGRNLPVMDRASDTTDAFVEIKFGNVTHKTDVCRKTLNPHWNSTEWYRFEVDESELQDEPLQLRLMDHDTYSANDAIGKVVISLAPLLAREANNAKGAGPPGAVLSGWIPVFDTMHGIRGELNVIVKVELFSDFNKYKTSSCGVQFFHCPSIPPGYKATAIHGFVEELVVNDDPEYQWIDKIRTPRASNEARQVAFIKLSNQVQRLVGLKAAELGANAVVGYQQDFDLEGEAGVVARATGTAVSLIPPPTPIQSINIPPCTQQQLKKYLDILATDNESVVDLNQYFQSHRSELQRLLNIMNPKTPDLLDDPENVDDEDKNDFTRQSSIKSYTGWYHDDVAQSLKHISEDQIDLNKLLNRNDDSDSDSTGPLKKIKKLKTNFTKRLGSLRSRKSDKQDDTVSLQSNSSDNSRISITDLRNEFKKFKRMKKPKFRKTFTNNEDEGIGMASILARSVIHAHTSLACIAEKDSEHSPSSTMRRTSESEPTINVSDDERKPNNTEEYNPYAEQVVKVPEIHTSLKNVNVDDVNISKRERKLSESCPASPIADRNKNLLTLPDETEYFGSLSLSGDSSEVYTSSEDEDDSSDQNADTEKSVETTSSVVQSVLNKNINPAIIAHMERKLSLLESVVPELKESKSHGAFETIPDMETSFGPSKSSPCIHENDNNETRAEDLEQFSIFCKDNNNINNVPKSDNHHFKFHNLFTHKKVSKCLSAPSSPVENKSFLYRSSKRIKQQFSRISKSNMFKSLSHYSLTSKKNNKLDKSPLSQPGSTSDVPSKALSHETVLGSPFLSYVDLMTLDKSSSDIRKKSLQPSDDVERSKVMMYIGSEPVSRASLSGLSFPYNKDEEFFHDKKVKRKGVINPIGLVHTAMETILIDKVQALLLPTAPVEAQSKEQQFFYDISEKLGKVEESRNQLRQYEFDKESSPTENRDDVSLSSMYNNKYMSLPATPSVSHGTQNKFFDDQHINRHSKHLRSKDIKEKHESLIQTAMKTILIEKVQSLIPETSESIMDTAAKDTIQLHQNVHNKHHDKKHSLVHTAMTTILIDKVHSLLPPSAEAVDTDEEHIDSSTHNTHRAIECVKENKDKPSLLHSAMETMLLEKAQVLIPAASETVTSDRNSSQYIQSTVSHEPEQGRKLQDGHSSLLHSAMETILMDRVQSIIPLDSEPVSFEDVSKNIVPDVSLLKKVEKVQSNEHGGLFNSALETILMDKVQSLIPIESETVLFEDVSKNTASDVSLPEEVENVQSNENGSLFNSAMETILMDKIQSLIPVESKSISFEDVPKNIVCDVSLPKNVEKVKSNENGGLFNSAMETILMDKVQSLIPFESEPVSFEDVSKNIVSDVSLPKKVEKGQSNEHGGLFNSALETILMDKVQSLIPIESETVSYEEVSKNTVSDVSLPEEVEKGQSNEHGGLFNSALETILMDKVQSLIPIESETVSFEDVSKNIVLDVSLPKKVEKGQRNEHGGLSNSVLETILVDKVHSLIPVESEPVLFEDVSKNTVSDVSLPEEVEKVQSNENGGLFNSAMETILMDKVQSLIPVESKSILFEDVSKNIVCDVSLPKKVEKVKSNESGGLFNSAMETILMDKVQSLIPVESEPVSFEDVSKNIVLDVSLPKKVEKGQRNEHGGLFNSALETILVDKVQALIPSSSESIISGNESIHSNIVQTQLKTEEKEENQHNQHSTEECLEEDPNINNQRNEESETNKNFESLCNSESSSTAVESELNKNRVQSTRSDDNVANAKTIRNNSSDAATEILYSNVAKDEQLDRKDSMHNKQSQKISKETSANIIVSSRVARSKPVLQHFHPILSGKPLETIPSLPECCLHQDESLDVDNVTSKCADDNSQSDRQCKECDSGTNSASVCDNLHAACGVDRNEREKDKTCEKEKGSPRHARHESYGGREPVVTSQSTQNSSFTPSTPVGIHRRSSDSDLSVTPKGGSLNASLGNTGSGGGAILRPSMNSSNIEMLEYPFMTMTEYPPGLIVHLGGTVCARSVKLVDAGGESAARAAWWAELRTELRAHARALRCNAVIAYTESAAICEDVCVLSASGTAAVINLDCDFGNDLDTESTSATNYCKGEDSNDTEQCTLAHVPYSPGAGPYRAELSTCGGCKRARVPAVLLATCAKPKRLPAYAKAVTVTAVAARIRRAPPAAEPGARDISDQLPFLEYELHKLLLAKLRMQGANALFSLQTQIAIGERCVMALASGTAVRLATLPTPTPPRIKASENDKDALDIQRALWDSFTANKAANGYDIGGSADTILPNGALPEPEAEDAPALDLCADKDACLLELDEAEDVETAKTLAARRTHMPIFTNAMRPEKGASPQMFAQVWRARLVLSGASGSASAAAERHVARALDGVAYKLRRLQPCALVAPHFHIELPEDEIQLVVSGAAISIEDPSKPEQSLPETALSHSNNSSPQQNTYRSHYQGHNADEGEKEDNEDDIFALDEEQLVKTPPPPVENDDKSLILNNGQVPTTVTLTTLGYITGSRAERRVCALRLLFVRETTAVRELGGLSGFLHTFTCEVLAIARAYTAALGGNALTSFYITQLMLQDNAHKNQGQCLLSVGGDVVHITY